MSSTRRLVPLLKRAQDKQDAVARQMAERQKVLDTHAQRLAELRQYTDEYLQAPMTGVNTAALLNRRAFIDRLESAVKLQAQTVERNRQLVEAERQRLIAASRELQVLQTLNDRYREMEQAASNRRDQRVLDDLGARLASQARQARTEEIR